MRKFNHLTNRPDLSMNKISIGECTQTAQTSRFKGIFVGREQAGFFAYMRKRTPYHHTPQEIPQEEINHVLLDLGIPLPGENPPVEAASIEDKRDEIVRKNRGKGTKKRRTKKKSTG